MKKNHPELLAPAGTPEALKAAIAAGADAVYFGTSTFNARMNAKNFSGDTLSDAVKLCRDAGVKTNITLNTLVHTREMYSLLKTVEELYTLGADALIVADLGAASLIHEYFPDFELHASTQVAGHNTFAAKELKKLGFSRMVAARELSFENIEFLCENSPIETEIFIHGAICVSQSGQCLASSMIGGRSGNRGECAQPCRLQYENSAGKKSYALSLKDICLAKYIPKILKTGVASLKIEGRMKSPDYVYGVTSIYRRLIDENRVATFEEIDTLGKLFSRSGFTDGYFVGKINNSMLGIRTDSDKKATKNNTLEKRTESADYKKIIAERVTSNRENSLKSVNISAEIRENLPTKIIFSSNGCEVTVLGQIPDKATNCPLTRETVKEKLTKLGGTGFKAENIAIFLDDGLMLPVSALNRMRREATDELNSKLSNSKITDNSKKPTLTERPKNPEIPSFSSFKTARVEFPDRTNIPPNNDFDIIYVPVEKLEKGMNVNGIIIPPVVFDSEFEKLEKLLKNAQDIGIKHALVSNIGHIDVAKRYGFHIHGDFRLNIYNNWTSKVLIDLGFENLIASPELTVPQLRDLGLGAVVYGRIPLMTLEKCCIRDIYSCKQCKKHGFLQLIDRLGISFPLTRAWEHRNILYNSVPIYMADRPNELSQINSKHFIFTDEDIAEISSAYNGKKAPKISVRRIKT